MGDRCYVTIEVAPQDVERCKEWGYSVDDVWGEPETSGAVLLAEEEANYGNLEFLEELQKAGVPFLAFNEAGGSYAKGVTACDGKELAEAEVSHDGDRPIVSMLESGQFDEIELGQARDYYRVLKLAKIAITERVAQHQATEATTVPAS